MTFSRFVLPFIFVLASIQIVSPQKTDSVKHTFWQNKSFTLGYQYGYVFPTNDFVKGLNATAAQLDEYQDFSLKFSKQTTGEKLWEQLYNYPEWGIGLYAADFFNSDEVGTPFALFGFLKAPFVRWNTGSFNYELGFGASTHWRSFNPLTNSYNTAIGAGQAFFINAGLNLDFEIDRHVDLITGFSLNHFSNGALKIPNSGINTVAPRIGIRYNVAQRPKFIKQIVPGFKPHNEWEISVFVSAKNLIFDTLTNVDILEKYEGVYFTVTGFTLAYNRWLSRKSKVGIGLNFAYNESVNGQIAIQNNDVVDVDGPFMEKFELSIFPSYELVVHKMSLVLQPAFYLYRKKLDNLSPVFHQRIGLKYHFTDNIYAGIILRDYAFHVSDFIEWTVGYSFETEK
ncbi:MAG: acyloxyacyl hydrolase [Paludibacter sp.]|nr:acyloxyacyl hydrolase [Paludibacter sp.]